MKYALVILEAPNAEAPEDTQALRNLAHNVLGESQGKIPRAHMLNPGAYLLPLEHGLKGLSLLVDEAASRSLRLHTLFFEEKPTFVS